VAGVSIILQNLPILDMKLKTCKNIGVWLATLFFSSAEKFAEWMLLLLFFFNPNSICSIEA
jgi:hypothetical protein